MKCCECGKEINTEEQRPIEINGQGPYCNQCAVEYIHEQFNGDKNETSKTDREKELR